jgi:RHS repeat-associated protein
VALYTRPSSGSVTTRYLLHDHQGSVAEIVGGSEVSESFGAYGERRDPADWSGPIGSGDATAIAAATPRGYTMHGHLEASALIHMNGRVADALTGRFLSPDPYVPYPGLTQSFNRYSYVHNNPLTYTDPSGFTLEFGGLFDIDGGISLSFKWGGRKHSRQQAPSPVKGCFVPAASGCYGKAPASGLFDIVFDVLRGPMPNYGRYDDLVLYFQNPYDALTEEQKQILEECKESGCDLVLGQQRPIIDDDFPFRAVITIFDLNIGNFGVHKIVTLLGRRSTSIVNQPNVRQLSGQGRVTGINVSEDGLSHVLERHTIGGTRNAGKSIFGATEDIGALIQNGSNIPRVPQAGGNFQRVVDAGRTIGIDVATGQPTSVYTIITSEADELITAFPGLPLR